MKLINSNTPGLLENSTRPIKDANEYELLLRMKLMEEAAEVSASTSIEEMTAELSDLQAVMGHLMRLKGISQDEVDIQRNKKRQEKGTLIQFAAKVLLFDPPENKHK